MAQRDKDLPITEDQEEQEVRDLDTPLEEGGLPEPRATSHRMRNTETLQAAAIETDLEPEKPLFSAFQEISQSEPDIRGALKSRAAKRSARDREDYLSVFKESPGETDEEVRQNTKAVQTVVNELDREAKDEDLQFVRSVSQGTLDPDTEERIAVNVKIQKMIQQISDNMGITDKVLSFGGYLVPGNVMKDNLDMTGSIFDAQEWMRNFVLNFKQLDPEEQIRILPTVRTVLMDELDNEYKVIEVLNDLLQPGGEEDLEQFNALWVALDVTDVATLGATTALKIGRSVSRLNAIRSLEVANDTERAAVANAGAIIDPNIAEAANIRQETTAVNNATGFNVRELDPAQAQDIGQASLQRIEEFTAQVQASTNEISGSDMFLREGLLQKAERESVERARIEELQSVPNIENVTVAERGDNVTTFEFDVNHADGSISRKRYNMQLTLDDVGQYQQSTVGILSRWANSPTVWAKKNFREDVDAAIRADSANAKVMEELIALQREATKSILGPAGLKGINPRSRKKLAELDEVLLVGDKEKRVFTPLELKAGVNGIKLDEDQIEAYYKTRSMVDALFNLRNNTKRQELDIKGMRHVNLGPEAFQIGKPFREVESAQGALGSAKPKIIWHKNTNQFVRVSDMDLAEEYAHGQRLVRFDEPTTPPGQGEKVNFALVHIDDVQELPSTVLHYRPGYIPKINLNANYFVKEFSATRIDGVNVAATDSAADTTTLRMFDNRKEAEEWAAQYQSENPNSTIRVLEDRQLEQERRAGAVDSPGTGGYGLYTGPRAAEDIPFGRDGLPPDRLGSFESISRNLASVSRYVPRNAWRLGMEQRAINTANALLPGTRFTHFNQLVNVPDTETGRFIRKMHDQIEEWMSFPTKEEQLWSAMMQETYERVGMAEWMPGFGKKSIQYLKHKDPIAAMRAGAFHSLLGWFNPVQLWVQAQGVSVAIATNIFRPTELANSIRVQHALAAVDHIENPKAIELAAKAFGMKTDELKEVKALWERTGLKDSILTTADHAAAARGHGVAMDALSRLSNKGLLFYRMGELFNRRLSFATALTRWKKNNPGKAVDSAALKDILTRSNNLMLNLTRANRAQWQKGAFSIPTQFLQISTKTIETLLGTNRNFTRAERAQIFLGQILLYGTAGIPLGAIGANWAVQALGYTSQADVENKLDPEMRKLLNEGFEGWATMALFGIDVDIGQRASLANGINQFADRLLFEDATMAEQFLGAFGTTGSRFWKGFTEVWEPLSLGKAGIRTFDPVQALSGLAETLSSWRNVSKALFMNRFDLIKDRHGRPIRHRDFTTREEIAQALGFRLSEEVQTWELQDVLKAKSELRSDVTDSVVKVMWDYALKANNEELTEDYKEATREKIALLMQTLDTPAERQKVREAVKRRMTEGTDEFTKTWRRIREEWNDGQVNLLEDWRNSLTSRGILQQQSVTDRETD